MKKIFIICSKNFYGEIPDIKERLDEKFQVFLPNCYDDPNTEDKFRNLGQIEHQKFKSLMYKQSENLIKNMDAVLVLNFDKGENKNYIGGATFSEMYDAFRMNKKIFLYNPIPKGMLYDEIVGFGPIIINSNLEEIK